ncbi:hypothetical protein ACJVC5_01985 [Peredibacter sp. HCB2-198]|uniref:hypothetical protein n=1 Tax=Peredibacter sp. HCB2-198 TaxID=3383025 RepID=UPI0038B52C9B
MRIPMGIRSELDNYHFDRTEKENILYQVRRSFKHFLSEETNSIWLFTLEKFATTAPWSYWDHEVIISALKILENDPKRTLDAIEAWHVELSIAFSELFNKVDITNSNESFDQNRPSDNLTISNQVHPEYLRLVEHLFGNLIPVFWGICRKKGVKASFNLGQGEKFFQTNDLAHLYSGFDDRIRNGIAHGEVHFKGNGIVYGKTDTPYVHCISSNELLDKMDELRRVINGLAIAIIIFECRNERFIKEVGNFKWPIGVLNQVLRHRCGRLNLEIVGIIESSYSLAGEQLQVSIHTDLTSKETIILDIINISSKILALTHKKYDRFMFQIDTDDVLPSTVFITTDILKKYLEQDKPLDKCVDFLDLSMLWPSPSHKLVNKYKVYNYLIKSGWPKAAREIQLTFKKKNLPKIREVKENHAGKDFRLDITITLDPGSLSLEFDDAQAICEKVVAKYKYKLSLGKKINLLPSSRRPRFPKYIWIKIYRKNGPIRWLQRRGWDSGNLMYTAEWKSSSNLHSIAIKKPYKTVNSIAYQDRLDIEGYNQIKENLEKLIQEMVSKP